MKKETITCDISDRKHDGKVKTLNIDVIFDHDQEDGKSKTKPYFDRLDIDLCEGCLNYIFTAKQYIYAYGAMGYNKYYLSNEKIS